MASELTGGAVIAGGYRLEQPLGRGGMGVVWAATGADGQEVAVKLMRNTEGDPKLVRRFLREARAAAAIKHPNVVRVIEALELDDGAPAIVMERLTGEPLSRRVVEGPALTVEEAASVMLPVVSAVGAAHAAGIVHRDLKPENIFLTREPDGTRGVKVLDFGIAKLTAEGEAGQTVGATTTGALLGTPSYMSPEQVFGEKNIDHRTDIWSIGMILYECLSGLLPTQAENVGQILKLILTREDWHFDEAAPDAPDDVKDLVRRMLLRDPKQRPELHDVAAVLATYAKVEVPDFGEPTAPRALAETPSETPRSDRSRLAFASTVQHDSGAESAHEARRPSAPSPGSTRALWRRAAVPLGLAAGVGGAILWWSRDPTPDTRTESPASTQLAPLGSLSPVAEVRAEPPAPLPSASERPSPSEKASPALRKLSPTSKQASAPSARPSAAPAPPPAPPPSSGSLTHAIQPKPPF